MRESVLLAVLLVLLWTMPSRSAPPTAKERARLLAEANKTDGEFWALVDQGKMREALSRGERLLALTRKLFPKEQYPDGHPNLAHTLNQVGFVLHSLGRLEAALDHQQQALAMRQKLFSPDKFPNGHKDLAGSLNNMGNVLRSLGRLEPALEHYQQALAMFRQLFPPDRFPNGHPDLAGRLNNVGDVLQSLGRLEPALEHYQQALAIRRKLFPSDKLPNGHTTLAASLNKVGNGLRSLGRLEAALEYQEQALAMRKKLFPPDKFPNGHRDLADSLDYVGSLLRSLGRREAALEHHQQALAMNRQLFPPDKFPNGHTNLAASLTYVGKVLPSLGRLEAALEHQQQALAMCQKLYPADKFPNGHKNLADSLNYIGSVLGSLGRLELALEHQQQALAMNRQLFPPDKFPNGHEDLAASLNNVGNWLESLDRLEPALEHVQQALAMYRKLFPLDRFPNGHTELARNLNNVGRILLASGKPAAAADVLAEALRVQRGLIDQLALGVSEAEALAFARATLSSLDDYLSATTRWPDSDPSTYAQVWTQRSALSRILQRRHLAALTAATANPEIRGLFDRLQQTRQELAVLLLAPLPDSPEAQRSRDRRVNELTEAKQRLERELIGLLPEADRQRRLDRLGPDDLANALPHDAAFVDLLRYNRAEHDPNNSGDAGQKVTASYVAFVVVRGRPVRRVELGAARAIEVALADWRHQIEQRREQDSPEAAAKLRRLLWEPLLEALPQPTRTVFLAPDAALTRLPWSALPGRQRGTILLEDHALAVIPHGPFLLEKLTSPGRFDRGRSAALALGGVGYGTPAPGQTLAAYSALPGSAREMQLLQKLYGGKLTSLEGRQADVTHLLESLPKAALAHLATHGFFNERVFRQEQERAQQQTDRLLRSQELVGEGTGRRVTQGALNPLSYTGLVLAGANQPKEAGVHGGILAGEALLTLDLRGLELAVLSACQTGLGEVANGECVHNLQQAFHSAGCPNVVASLWSVPDEATAALMGLFYHALLEEKQPPLQALRAAQLYLYRHPNEIPELAKHLERGAPLVAKGVKVAEPDSKPVAPAPSDRQRAAAKDWAGFVLSGVGR